ncbi:GIY-YIG nuclease family protein [Bradyrhizobium elkanii]|uniref:GIY-YIG nuclease family protein n=1 Tax=Bradyrhizobium elkanii TaxID=29448 RepID=UPI00272B7556|nr:GIY-YIG nuclease family protein [Bradyrhizobium elkanii]WLA80334.1 GIY-YIG nuclease family protein [Bradyrhizobium elkanii]
MNHWFRLYNTLVDDPKVQQLPDSLFKALINLWCVASQNDGVLPSNGDIAYKLRIKPEKAAEYVTKLVRAGLLDNIDGAFVPHNWDGRQYKSPKSDDGADPKGKYVYFVTAGSVGSVKIGVSKNPWARVAELQTGYPDKLSIAATFKTRATSEVDLHDLLADFRRQGEWFDLPASVMNVVLDAHTAKSDYVALMLLLRSELRKEIRSSYVAGTREDQSKVEKIDVAEDAREPLVSDAARDLADELLVIAGHELRFVPPGWCGAAMRVHTWLAQGWPREIILVGARKATAKSRGRPINSVQFYENAIAEEVARQAEPLPRVEVRQPEHLTVIANGKSQGGNIIQAADRLLDKIRSFDAGPSDDNNLRDGASEASARLLSQG